jgi:Lamin Tail Domain
MKRTLLLVAACALVRPALANAGTCVLAAGQVLINEVLPAPSGGAAEWVELFNTTPDSVNIGDCYLDDIAGEGGSPYRIPAGTTMAGLRALDPRPHQLLQQRRRRRRLLKTDFSTVVDSFTYGSAAYDRSWYRSPDGGSWQGTTTPSPTKGGPNPGGATCGDGTWVAGNLEIHHINIGQGDATLIVGPTARSLLADAGESYWSSHIDADTVGPYIDQVLGCKRLDYVLISHFHVDHPAHGPAWR